MVETTARTGKSAYDIVEELAGGLEHRALLLCELQGAAEAAGEEFGEDDGETARGLARRARELARYLALVSVTPDAGLTLYRECRRCSGEGEVGCLECGGSGSVHTPIEVDG